MTTGLHALPPEIGRYQLVDLLGRGGMGRIVRAHDPILKRQVALKLVEPAAVAEDDLAELRNMFHREARAMAQLKHPSIIEVYDYSGPEAELLYVACELVEAPTLRDILEERGPLRAAVATALAYELAQALAHAHAADIVHRDLKPENIFWSETGRVVLSDFGIAKALGGRVSLGGTVRLGATNIYGSPAYMAPEQLKSGEAGPGADLHALGAILYECLSGTAAFPGGDLDTIMQAVVNPMRPQLPRTTGPSALFDLCYRLLLLDPAERPASASQVEETLREALNLLDVTDPRLQLRGWGTNATPNPAIGDRQHERENTTEIFASIPQAAPVYAERSSWESIAARVPFFFAMATIALALGGGAYLLKELGVLASTPLIPAEQKPIPLPEIFVSRDVNVVLTWSGNGSLWVDDELIGAFDDRVRLMLPAGKHRFEVRRQSGNLQKEAFLIEGTEPKFELH